jgi:hypothetical protein
MRLNLNYVRRSLYPTDLVRQGGWVKRAAVLLAVCLFAASAAAQTELTGPVRDIARAAIVYPVVFDPLITMPLTPGPQGVVDVHGSDLAATAHIAIRSGDDSYGVIASVPLSTGDPSTSVDPRGLRRHASLGFHLTNIIWRPKATPAFERELGAAGFVHLDDSGRRRAADLIETTDAVSVPWVLFINADYRFNHAEYEFADARTLEKLTDNRLNDTASMLFGVQLFARPRDPGYFFGFSYTYSAVFQQFGGTAANGLPVEGPTKVRGNLLRVEMRRPLGATRYGVIPSVTHENNSGVTTTDVTGYARFNRHGAAATGNLRGPYVGGRIGNESKHDGRGGIFATVFVGWEGWGR